MSHLLDNEHVYALLNHSFEYAHIEQCGAMLDWQQEDISRALKDLPDHPRISGRYDDSNIYPEITQELRSKEGTKIGNIRRLARAFGEWIHDEDVPVKTAIAIGSLALHSIAGVGSRGTHLSEYTKLATRIPMPNLPEPEQAAFVSRSLAEVPATISYETRNGDIVVRAIADLTMQECMSLGVQQLAAHTEHPQPTLLPERFFDYQRRFLLSRFLFGAGLKMHGISSWPKEPAFFPDTLGALMDSIDVHAGPEADSISRYSAKYQQINDALKMDVSELRSYAKNDQQKQAVTLLQRGLDHTYNRSAITTRQVWSLGTKALEALYGMGEQRAAHVRDVVQQATGVEMYDLPNPEVAAYFCETLSDIPSHTYKVTSSGPKVNLDEAGTMHSFPERLRTRGTASLTTKTEVGRDYFRGYRRRFLLAKLIYEEINAQP